MSKKFVADMSVDDISFCCGMMTAGSFDSYPILESAAWANRYGFPTLKEAWINELTKARDECGKRPIVFNFVKRSGNRIFDNKELRTLVREQPDCLFVHKWKNPGSGNTLECYVLTNGSK
jgi:hypothetical protein